MHKLKYYFAGLLTLLLAGCSSDDITGRTDSNDTTGDAGYLRMSISMPSARDSRATSNDDFHNGLASEYKVNTATLILLEGDTDDEMQARFHSAYTIPVSMLSTTDDPTQVTTTTRIVRQLVDGDEDFRKKHHFVLLALNTGDQLSVSLDHRKITFLGNTYDMATNKVTFGVFLKYTLNAKKATAFSPSQGIMMFNAPLASKPGGSVKNDPTDAKVTYLADVTDKIYDTENEAINHPATNVYVERAVAKVTVDPANSDNQYLNSNEVEIIDATSTQTSKIPWKLVGWKLNNTNNTSYIIRNYSTAWNGLRTQSSTPLKPYRFIGDTPLSQTDLRYRTYWAEDPNYTNDGKDHSGELETLRDKLHRWDFNSAEDTPTSTTKDPYPMGFGEKWPQYCFENTFDVANQSQDQSTGVIAKIQIGDGQTDYYVVNDDKTHLYTWEALNEKYHLDEKIKEFYENDKEVLAIYNTACYESFDEPSQFPPMEDVIDYSFSYNDDGSGDIHIGSIGFDFSNDPNAILDYYSVLNYKYNDNNISLILGQDISIKKYENGIAYYPIRIKHFGDDLTPWNKDESTAIRPGVIYPNDANRDNNYLGRYGVVRNNWYNIHVNSVFGIGSPIIPDTPDTPDDELSNYISVGINVLSWTLRDQGADL